MRLLIPHECHYCSVNDEARFTYSGPHIKQVCNNCGRYVKFFSPKLIPDIRVIKLQTWAIIPDKEAIDVCKGSIGFTDQLTGTDEKLQYWKLYLEIRKEFL